jgi:hypothetical protein
MMKNIIKLYIRLINLQCNRIKVTKLYFHLFYLFIIIYLGFIIYFIKEFYFCNLFLIDDYFEWNLNLSKNSIGTDGTQLGLEGAHCGTVAIPPTPRAEWDSNSLFGGKDSKSNVAKHGAVALEAAEVLSTLGIVNVEEHHTGV